MTQMRKECGEDNPFVQCEMFAEAGNEGKRQAKEKGGRRAKRAAIFDAGCCISRCLRP